MVAPLTRALVAALLAGMAAAQELRVELDPDAAATASGWTVELGAGLVRRGPPDGDPMARIARAAARDPLEICIARLGGDSIILGAGALRPTGDGRFVIDYGALRCEGEDVAPLASFCGAGGCPHEIWSLTPEGRPQRDRRWLR